MEVDCLFQVGDKVFYPMHGAGVVEAIEEREFQGKPEKYCVIAIPSSQMNVMIPMKKLEQAGLRSVVDRKKLKDLLHIPPKEEYESRPWKQRYNSNMEKIKTGKLPDSLEVVRELQYRSKEKPLNASEKQLLNNAQRLIISELALIKGITENQAADLLEIPS